MPTCCVSILVFLLVRGMAKTSILFDQQPLLMTQVRASLRRELENLEWEAHAAKESASDEEARRKEVQLEADQLRCSESTLFLGRLSFHLRGREGGWKIGVWFWLPCARLEDEGEMVGNPATLEGTLRYQPCSTP